MTPPRIGASRDWATPTKAPLPAEERRRGTISRILYPAPSADGRTPGGDHSSSPAIAGGVEQPTRRLRTGRPRAPPYSVLLRAGFSLPSALRRTRCALTAPFHPYRPAVRNRNAGRRYVFCATFLQVALTGDYPAHCPSEFGLSSPPDARRAPRAAVACPSAARQPFFSRRFLPTRQSSPSAPPGAQPTLQESAPFHGAGSQPANRRRRLLSAPQPGLPAARTLSRRALLASGPSHHNLRIRTWVYGRQSLANHSTHARTFSCGAALVS